MTGAQNLGFIATQWLIIADQSDNGIRDRDCLKLAQLHSDAVDYQKSGTPVKQREIPRLKFAAKPDWNAPETIDPGEEYYRSERAIGKLFRDITLPAVRDAKERAK